MAWRGGGYDPPQALPWPSSDSLLGGSIHFFQQEAEAHRRKWEKMMLERQGGGTNEVRGMGKALA